MDVEVELDVGTDMSGMRRTYEGTALDPAKMPSDPMVQFKTWLKDAVDSGTEADPNAMTLATAGADGAPNARMVLLKGVDERGFRFFTNYTSQKGQELVQNPRATLVLWWQSLSRSVRIYGDVEKISDQESEEYFNSRPVGSQIGAIISTQSKPLRSRDELVDEFTRLMADCAEGKYTPKRPAHWGGFVLKPTWVEFWQGQPSRLHDRIRYKRQQDGTFSKEALFP